MSNVDLHDFKQLYCQTAQEYLTGIHTDVEELLVDLQNKEKIENLFIKVHSLKSQSLVMGYMNIGMLAKSLETILREVKEEKQVNTLELMNKVKEAATSLQGALSPVIAGGEETDLSKEIAAFEGVQQHTI